MATTPMAILNRPFSIEPLTGIMLPDGIFDAAIFEQQITAYYTNQSSHNLHNVDIYFEGISDLSISVAPATFTFPLIPAGASVRVSWMGNFQNATPGKKNVSIVASAAGMNLIREIKQIFVTKTTFDTNTQTYTCVVPEGSLKVKILQVIKEKPNCDSKFPPLALPVKLEMVMEPNPSYEGQFGDLPFHDPWWKIIAWIVFALAAIGAFIAAAFGGGKASIGLSGGFDESTGSVTSCCKPSDGLSVSQRATVAGVLSTIASVALVVGCSDAIDPWRRGEEATPTQPGEITLSESLKLDIIYLQAPAAGEPYPVEVDWTYTRVTNIRTYEYHIHEIQNNIHTLKDVKVDVPSLLQIFNGPFIVKASFIRDDDSLFAGSSLYVFSLIVSPAGVAFIIPLSDDGIGADIKANDGVYTGNLRWEEIFATSRKEGKAEDSLLGYWRVYVYAQDTNDATAAMDPLEAATHVGGVFVASASGITFDGSLPCPLKANATVLVVA